MITTEAWVLHQGPPLPVPGELRKESFTFPDLTPEELLVEPIYGCWEGNMTHALQRDPIDICRFRKEEKVVIGNSGVVRVLKTGSAVTRFQEGDLCLLCSVATWDEVGYPLKILAYDAPGTMGVLAKRMKLHQDQLWPIFRDTKFSLPQWAAFPIRYGTAWDNWKVAFGAWRLQMNDDDCPVPHVWGWGGGVTLAQLALAKQFGCRTAMISSRDTRLELIKSMGITPIDRREFLDLQFDEVRFKTDFDYRRSYMRAEIKFLEMVKRHTNGQGVSIFVDNVGGPVYRATLKALGRQGVITTVGWKRGMDVSLSRGTECIERHIHVHTHGIRKSDAALHFAEETGWMPPISESDTVYGWDDIPALAEAYRDDTLDTYFPVFQVNPL
ncbi:zinc-binding dehydrogenase [Anaerolineales bacterium HSG6]|nr:zinc-binding dehydrogenase [Anaerolineales bacterium HSG6]